MVEFVLARSYSQSLLGSKLHILNRKSNSDCTMTHSCKHSMKFFLIYHSNSQNFSQDLEHWKQLLGSRIRIWKFPIYLFQPLNVSICCTVQYSNRLDLRMRFQSIGILHRATN